MVPWLKDKFRDFNNGFDWSFLVAVLIPVLEVQPDSIAAQDFITALCNKVLFTLLHERETGEHLTFAAKLKIGVRSQESGARRKEEEGRRKEPEEVFLQI